MASSVTRDHHNLRRNLKLNSNYLSNDGGDEGISIADDGDVTMTSNDTQLKIAYDGSDYTEIKVANLGILEIATSGASGTADIILDAEGDIILEPSEAGTPGVIIDKNHALGLNSTLAALQIDYDHTGIVADTQTVNASGLDIDMNCDSVTHVGTVNQTGIDIDMVAADDGTQTNAGIDITTSGADKNFGLKINNEDNGTTDGTEADFINYSSADNADYFYMNTEGSGETTLGTIDGGGTGGHINLAPNGKLNIHSGSGSNPYAYFHKVTDYDRFRIFGFGQTDDYLNIDVDVNGAATISTVDDNAQAAHLTLSVDGNIVLGCNPGGAITLQENDASAYTPSTASDATTKAYVDTGDNTQYHFIKCGFNNGGTARLFIPLAAAEDMREVIGAVAASERVCFICPFDGSVETMWARSEEACGSTIMGMHVGTGNTETPSATATQSVTVDMSVDDTSYEFDFASAGTNTFSQGNILMFTVDPTSAMNDVHFMIVLKFDVST